MLSSEDLDDEVPGIQFDKALEGFNLGQAVESVRIGTVLL
jgi:hypothetical protein